MIEKLCNKLTKKIQNKMPEIEVIPGKTILKENYPYDISYNAARVGNNIICNKNFTDDIIIEFANKNGLNLINTKQGYAKCSICVVSNDAIITSDKNIQSVAIKNGIDVLLVNDNEIKLAGFDHGFIGGATGLLNKNLLAVNGNIKLHTNYNEIMKFCAKHNVEVISLNNDEIIDIGSILIV